MENPSFVEEESAFSVRPLLRDYSSELWIGSTAKNYRRYCLTLAIKTAKSLSFLRYKDTSTFCVLVTL